MTDDTMPAMAPGLNATLLLLLLLGAALAALAGAGVAAAAGARAGAGAVATALAGVAAAAGAGGFAAAGAAVGAGLAARARFTAGGVAIDACCWTVFCFNVPSALLSESVLTGGALVLLPLPLLLSLF
jgi:hypothetical protein